MTRSFCAIPKSLERKAGEMTSTATLDTIAAAPPIAEPTVATPAPAAAEVRVATRADEPQLLELLRLMHAEGGLVPLDVDRARSQFAKAFERQGGIIGVIGAPGNIEAAIFLLITQHWYAAAHHLEELFCFVRPDCRHSNHATTLITFAKDCAEKIGLPLLIGITTGVRMAAKVRMYRRILGPPAGAYFICNAKWGSIETPAEDFWSERLARSAPAARESTAAISDQGHAS
jgi:N-acetylglutamate synthase-like GNAT family acetyltransferase